MLQISLEHWRTLKSKNQQNRRTEKSSRKDQSLATVLTFQSYLRCVVTKWFMLAQLTAKVCLNVKNQHEAEKRSSFHSICLIKMQFC